MICHEGSKSRCLHCFSGGSKDKCVPIDPVLSCFARELRNEINGPRRNAELRKYRITIRQLQEHAEEVVDDILSNYESEAAPVIQERIVEVDRPELCIPYQTSANTRSPKKARWATEDSVSPVSGVWEGWIKAKATIRESERRD
ncbi:hypothetical protein LY76DRAFT_597449 [Colletotrichum caudatum]|nr:hypothetical protein LY76DRAFT_597449 [Colletotrichum caudatum]